MMVVVGSILSTLTACNQPSALNPRVEKMQKKKEKTEHTSKLNALDMDRRIGFNGFRLPAKINQVFRRENELSLHTTKLRVEENRFFMRYHTRIKTYP